MKILMVYGTTDGQTEKIARFMGDRLRAHQHAIEIVNAAHLRPGFALDGVDAVIVGAPLRMMKYPRAVIEFVRAHRTQLEQIPCAFFSVCMAAASPIESRRREAEGWPEDFFRTTGWRPLLATTFAGALRYRSYSWPLRWLMRRIARSEGVSTDTSRDHEYTDWEAVTRLADTVEKATANRSG